MVMETDANNSEVYFKINKNYQLKSSDSVLTELGYDDISRLDRNVANNLVQTLIRSYILLQSNYLIFSRIPKEIIEEALSYSISDETYNSVIQASLTEARIPRPLEASGMNAIMKAAKQLDSGRRVASVETPVAVSTLPTSATLPVRPANANANANANATGGSVPTTQVSAIPSVSSVAVSNRNRVNTTSTTVPTPATPATPAMPTAIPIATPTTTIPEGDRASTPELPTTTVEEN